MPLLDRRTLLAGGLATVIANPVLARSRAEIWMFDNLKRIGGLDVRVQGDPRIIASPSGPAMQFDGVDDAIFLNAHPLAGAGKFSFEVLFRPDGGAFEQRWFHLESAETPPVAPGTGRTRILFEIRVVGQNWYLDAFMRGEGYNLPLIVPEKLFPVGRWYHVAQSYDGTTYRSYVDGVLQAEAPLAFTPQGAGRACVGMRMNQVNPFRGAVRQAAFTRGEALSPGRFVLPIPR